MITLTAMMKIYNGMFFRSVQLTFAAFTVASASDLWNKMEFLTHFVNGSRFNTDVTMNDRGLYSCNLHHLYCHLYEMVKVQLNVTKSRT